MSLAPVAQAHVWKEAGTVRALLHIDPDAYPVTKEEAGLTLGFIDSSSQFSLAGCDCTLTIWLGKRKLTTQALKPVRLYKSNNPYTFSKPGVYKLVVSARPKPGASFLPLTLTYNVRVEEGDSASSNSPPILLVGAVIAVALLAGAAILYYGGSSKKQRGAKHGKGR